MEEEEAEAVLVALGPRLEWELTPEDAFSGGLPGLPDPDYCVYGDDEAGWLTQLIYEDGVEDGPDFSTADAAKLACERHHATGKWE